jgi:hypothetical protein
MRPIFYRIAGRAKSAIVGITRLSIDDQFVTRPPSPQHALDIFKGEWLSALPSPLERCEAGALPLFGDPRLQWAVDRLGGVQGAHVLELGPLEGGHTWMLEQMGAASVIAVEASTRAYLKCLTVKELTGMTRARFLCGDSVGYLRERGEAAMAAAAGSVAAAASASATAGAPAAASAQSNNAGRFDVAVASGILYHLTNPVELLAQLAAHADRLFLWTRYFDDEMVKRRPKLAARFAPPRLTTHAGFAHALHPYHYRSTRFGRSFSGGTASHAAWLTRDTILSALRAFGFDRIETSFEEPDHENGPAFALVATRAADSRAANSIAAPPQPAG